MVDRANRRGLMRAFQIASGTFAAALGTHVGWAQSASVGVDCPPLSREDAAQLEARVHATLLSSELDDARVVVTCTDSVAWLDVSRDTRKIQRSLPLRQPSFHDALIVLLEAMLGELGVGPPAAVLPAAEPVREGEPKPVTESKATAAPRERLMGTGQRARPSPEEASAMSAFAEPVIEAPGAPAHEARLRLEAMAVTESWSNALAYGADVGFRTGGKPAFGFAVGIQSVFEQRAAFSTTEFHTAAGLGYSLAKPGLALGAGLGLSLLSVKSEPAVTRAGPGTLLTPYLELSCARPIWFGPLAIIPALASRIFSGPRRIRVDGDEQLVVPVVTARVLLGFAYEIGHDSRSRAGALRGSEMREN